MKFIFYSGRFTKVMFVSLNILISILGFLRSFIFLKYLDLYDLGLVSIFQTVILLVGMSQLGIINGAYRAYAGPKQFYRKAINTVVFTFLFWVTVVGSVVGAVFLAREFSDRLFILILGCVAGVFSLATNYLTNTFLASSKIKEINIINLISNAIGYSSLLLILYNPFFGLVSFILQPLSFIVLALIFDRSLIPRKLFFSFRILKFLLQLGFIPYLTALFVYLNLQIERWTIVYSLGIENFGKFYLAIAFASVFALFPASINNLYFPRMIQAYGEKNLSMFDRLHRQYTLILVLYCLTGALATFLLAPVVVDFFFPQHSGNLKYVFYTLPGIMCITIANPYILYFNASLKLRPLLYSYAASTILILILVATLYASGNVSLKSISIADSLGNISILLLVILFYTRLRRRENEAL